VGATLEEMSFEAGDVVLLDASAVAKYHTHVT